MYILAFETSLYRCSVAIARNNEILFSYTESTKPENLVCLLEKALNYVGIWYQDIDYVTCIVGPGSFTGTRISIAAARSILITTNAIGLGVTNFELMQFYAPSHDVCVAMLDAGRGQIYVQVFGDINTIEPHVMGIEQFIITYGKGLRANAPIYIAPSHEVLELAPPVRVLYIPSAQDLALYCWHYQNKSTKKIAPLYIRSPIIGGKA